MPQLATDLADELEYGLELLQALPRGDGEDQDEGVTLTHRYTPYSVYSYTVQCTVHCVQYTVVKLRKRIYTEDKAKVTAAVWGTEFMQFLAAQVILY